MSDHFGHDAGEWRYWCEACSGLPNDPTKETRTVGSLTAHDIGNTVTVRDTSGKLRRVEHLPDGRTIIQVAAFPESFFTNEPCEVEGKA